MYAVRELARAGGRVLGIDARHGCAQHSNQVQEHWRIADSDELLARLSALRASQSTPPVLLPTSDHYIEFVAQNATTLRDQFRFASCYSDVATVLLDKQQFHQLCQRHGLDTPQVWQAQDRTELDAVIDEICYPCILKPALIHRARVHLRGNKVLLARSRRELIEVFARLPDDVGGWLIQEVIPGTESNITLFAGYVNQAGEMQQAFTARKLRQYPPGFGSASLVESAVCPETARLSIDFLRAIGFRGVCGTEFKRDPRDGRLKIIEINPRPTLWFQLSHDANKRIVEAAWRDLSGLAVPEDRPQREDVQWRYALKDVASAWFYFRHRDFVFPAPETTASNRAQRKSWAVFDWRDPLPTLAEPLAYLYKSVWGR
ncbi:MAG: hypothetical protein ABI411_07345 [Tahibacter sp.]